MKKNWFQFREAGILLALIIICVVTAVINPVFISKDNLIDVLRSISFTLIISVGMTFVLISAGLDLSVGSIIGLAGMITGWALVNQVPIPLAILLGMFAGGVFGLFNGVIIVKFKIPPLIVTLGTMYIARGIIYVISKGRPYYPFPDSFKQLGQGKMFGIPYAIYIALIVTLAGHYVLTSTVFGRSLMALGGNEEATRVAGINTEKIKLLSYVIVALCASFTGILMAARLSSSQAAAGTGWELTVIASVIIGGTSMYGGSGSILGTVIGTALMVILSNSMVLLGVSVYWQKIFVGLIIILAVGIDNYRRSKVGSMRG